MKTKEKIQMDLPARSQWPRFLRALQSEELIGQIENLTKGWQITPKTLPQSGLAMVQLEDTALHEPFYIGEVPLATSWVEIRTDEGAVSEGAAQIMDDNVELANTLAVCDGIVAGGLSGTDQITELLLQGERIVQEQEQRRRAMLAKTRVDFSLLDEAGKENAD